MPPFDEFVTLSIESKLYELPTVFPSFLILWVEFMKFSFGSKVGMKKVCILIPCFVLKLPNGLNEIEDEENEFLRMMN